MHRTDLSDRNVITGKDVDAAARHGAQEILLARDAVLTSTAREAVATNGIAICYAGKAAAPAYTAGSPSVARGGYGSPDALFRSAATRVIKEEIVRAGHKLWQREFVDGNGGNISVRLNDRYVLCTPTLLSKGDLTVDDLCIVDMDGKQVAGARKATSEILMHLAIYAAQPKAKGCVHAHPPHATAYAITGRVPPNCIIPEAEIFVGMVALAEYETPGTPAFAKKMTPLAQEHNTILLANHGVVCWADSVTHAEWCMEVVDTYCRTLILAAQLGAPIQRISNDKTSALMDIKRTLDIPDPRLSGKECVVCEEPERPAGITVCPKGGRCTAERGGCSGGNACGCSPSARPADPTIEALIQKITDGIVAKMG